MLRKGIFWIHLICGVIAGLVILMMSVTGVLLTYERQILAFSERAYWKEPPEGQQRLPLDLLANNASLDTDFEPTSVVVFAETNAPVAFRKGREQPRYMNPYSGDFYPPQANGVEEFFHLIVRWHRWFNAGDENRATARAITGVSNLMFLFLVVSGIYLWLPRIYRWSAFKLRLWFHPNAKSGKARDFNWHHVFGIWAAIPLLVIVATATVFNYSWANNLVYQLAGEEPPQRGRGRGAAPQPETQLTDLPLEMLLQKASASSAGSEAWQTLTIGLPSAKAAGQVEVRVDYGNGGQPQKKHAFYLETTSGELVKWERFSDLSNGRQARSWMRFLHTGEALGVVGQTLAGLASLAAALMVWTGIALSLRRFSAFRLRRKRAKIDQNLAVT